MKWSRRFAVAAATAAISVGTIGLGSGVANATPPLTDSWSQGPRWDWHDRDYDRWRRDDDWRGNGCISVTGPFGHVTWTNCG
jgi:hypothetical protein